jgi:hypothetical protein
MLRHTIANTMIVDNFMDFLKLRLIVSKDLNLKINKTFNLISIKMKLIFLLSFLTTIATAGYIAPLIAPYWDN